MEVAKDAGKGPLSACRVAFSCYKMFPGRRTDCSKFCIEVEKKIALFLGLIAGLKKSWRSKKRHAAAENKMDPQAG